MVYMYIKRRLMTSEIKDQIKDQVLIIEMVQITCEICGTDNRCICGELSVYCAECCNLLLEGSRHKEFPKAHRDAKERVAAWVLKNR